jgi:antitoxin CptB
MPADAADARSRRLLWRCRRGLKELDVVLERFATKELDGLPAEERELFGRLLELPDPVLVDYLLAGAVAAEPPLARLIGRIRDSAVAHAAR